MANRGLLFIPDISGFTRFVNEIEIEHSRYIIQQLLEILINANQTGLEVSEIEGDAILFYKFGEPLELEALYKQVERMFCAFHQHINAYNYRRICQCKACISAVNLSLKVISHYGEFTTYNVKNFSKLIGKDVIVAHQLLKNDIAQHEYWLVTDSLLTDEPPAGLARWMQWNSSVKQTETGAIPFHYTQLDPLKKEIPPDPPPQLELANKVKMLTVSKDYDIDIKTLCYTVVHFEFRHQWQVGLKGVDEVEHFLPGIGSSHRHVLENGQSVIMYTSSFVYDPEKKIMFSETDEKKKSSLYYTIEKAGDKSRLTLDFYLTKNLLRQTLFQLTQKKKMEQELQQSLINLDALVKTIVLPLEF
ncbi:DUF2652 domain-containing protein [Pseudoflavitalea sp. X16]|uniref:DUF2652 domain-containing protein n=1 Tax=Paraflavitalea devenefica TaxID=2716334 RepID=UPI00141DE48D|nr:DUF2652 domain-containing protein [Paraflavitalea devenefica]NII27645.1 DUF2652 domain-containing protein [Paraflavitalea devenefica]